MVNVLLVCGTGPYYIWSNFTQFVNGCDWLKFSNASRFNYGDNFYSFPLSRVCVSVCVCVCVCVCVGGGGGGRVGGGGVEE